MRIRYWQDRRRRAQVAQYFERIEASGDHSGAASFEFLVDLLIDVGPPLGMPRDRAIDRRAGLYELRAGNHRVAYAWSENTVWMLHAWRKQSRKLDSRALRTALRRLEDLDLG